MVRSNGWLCFSLRTLVVVVWGTSGLVFWALMQLRALAWLAGLPEQSAGVALALVSGPGMAFGICGLVGASSLLLWHRLPTGASAALAVLVPLLLFGSGLACGHFDTHGTEKYVMEAVRRGDVRGAREQLLIDSARGQWLGELQALIRVGTDANAQDLEGHSALYWTSDPRAVQVLLQGGAVPDSSALVEAVYWGRLDVIELLLAATQDGGRTLVAQAGSASLDKANRVYTSGEQDRSQIARLLQARGAILSPRNRGGWPQFTRC